jgi:hypothetical protein
MSSSPLAPLAAWATMVWAAAIASSVAAFRTSLMAAASAWAIFCSACLVRRSSDSDSLRRVSAA